MLFSTGEAVAIKMYGLVTYKEDAVPPIWALHGKSDDGEWVLLDARTKDEIFPKPICHYAESVLEIDAPAVYQHYKLTFETKNIFFLSQMHIYV